MTENKSVIFTKCTEKWGFNSQIDLCIEELAELTVALSKSKRCIRPKDWLASIYEEIADVTIMVEQMVNIFEGEEVVPQVIERKMKRLLERLK